MAWVTVPNNPSWEFDNTATIADTYPRTPGNVGGGIRTYTMSGGRIRTTFIKCRKINNPTAVGELDKTYYEARTP